MTAQMRAWVVTRPGPIDGGPLEAASLPVPEPGPGEVRVRIHCCGVCRTDLHVAEGDLPAHRSPVVPGHEIVGTVDARGPGAERFADGERIGVPWLRRTCGIRRFCTRGLRRLIGPGAKVVYLAHYRMNVSTAATRARFLARTERAMARF